MSAVVTTNTPQIIVEERVILQGLSWDAYNRIIKDYENRSAPRFTYIEGTLEIYMPTQKHEERNRFFELFVSAVAEERDLDIRSLGSTIFRKEGIEKAVEPDSCFYLQHAAQIAGNRKINLEKDPPPDLVVEVDITSPSLERFPVYAEFKVPEIWRDYKDEVQIFVLRGKKYSKVEESTVLSGVKAEVINRFLTESQTNRRSTWLKKLREWVHSVS